MITELTKEQEARLPEFRDKWWAIGLNTEEANRAEAEEGVKETYLQAKLPLPKKIYWTRSPKETYLLLVAIITEKKDPLKAIEQGEKLLEVAPKEAVEMALGLVRNQVWGQHDAFWLGFYDYFAEVCGLEEVREPLQGVMKVARNAGWWMPFDDFAIITERYLSISLNKENQLHRIDGPAVKYRDGFKVYALNGVAFFEDKWFNNIPATWDPKDIIKVANVEQRRELIRIIGVGPLLAALDAKTKHKEGDYELVEVFLSENAPHATYLKMPSAAIEGIWHVEGVPEECRTVQQAHNWRAYGRIDQEWRPIEKT